MLAAETKSACNRSASFLKIHYSSIVKAVFGSDQLNRHRAESMVVIMALRITASGGTYTFERDTDGWLESALSASNPAIKVAVSRTFYSTNGLRKVLCTGFKDFDA